MNERQAKEAGYTFHGCYERAHNKDKVVARAKELRKEGNQAVVVKVPDSKLSRGTPGHGYSVYWIESEETKAARRANENERRQDLIRNRMANLADEIVQLEQELKSLEEDLNT